LGQFRSRRSRSSRGSRPCWRAWTRVIDGTPRVDTYEVSNSTFHKIAARN